MLFIDNNKTFTSFYTNRLIVSFDFDDTLRNNIENKIMGNKTKFLLTLIQQSDILNIYPVIVTSRNQKLYEIRDFCIENKIDNKITYVIHSVKNKAKALKQLGASIHFDDDIEELSKLYDNGIVGFLSGEWFSDAFYNNWINKLSVDNVLEYYDKSHIVAKSSIQKYKESGDNHDC